MVDWKVTRSKVRYMRTTYTEMLDGLPGEGSMETETIKSKIMICHLN